MRKPVLARVDRVEELQGLAEDVVGRRRVEGQLA